MNRSHKRHPQTHLPDPNMASKSIQKAEPEKHHIANIRLVLGVSDTLHIPGNTSWYKQLTWISFHVGNPEGFHELLHLFSDRGTPASLRHMNAYSGHTYKFTTTVWKGHYP